MLLVPSKGEVILARGCRGVNGLSESPLSAPACSPQTSRLPHSSPSLAPTCAVTLPHIPPSVGPCGSWSGGATFTVPKSSSLMWPPPNSFFTVARVAAYSIFSRT